MPYGLSDLRHAMRTTQTTNCMRYSPGQSDETLLHRLICSFLKRLHQISIGCHYYMYMDTHINTHTSLGEPTINIRLDTSSNYLVLVTESGIKYTARKV